MTYSSSVASNRRQYIKRNQNSVAYALSPKTLGPISNTVILIALLCLIGLLYLTQVTKTNSYGYTINNLQQEQTQLKNQKVDLEVTAARLQALDRVAASGAANHLVPVTPAGSIKQ